MSADLISLNTYPFFKYVPTTTLFLSFYTLETTEANKKRPEQNKLKESLARSLPALICIEKKISKEKVKVRWLSVSLFCALPVDKGK